MYKSQPYYTTQLEDYMQHLYQSLSIFVPEQMDMMKVAQKLNIWLYFAPIGSCAMKRNGLASIVLDERKSQQEQFEDFGHEVAHLLFHAGNQLNMPKMFLDYQEAKAQNFAMHFCIPTFMLQKLFLPYSRLEAIELISNTFNVTGEFANRRLIHYQGQIIASRIQKILQVHYAV
ncbi:ImmA/IrrE family metallo-endopeptidase [Bacillus pseudomycoides]